MKPQRKTLRTVLALLVVVLTVSVAAPAQDSATVLTGADLTRVVPAGFYFQGQSAW